MALRIKNQRLRRIAFFFPFQLLMVVLKKNHLLLLFWLIMFGFITKSIAARYGVPFLFLSPEYLDKINFWSYFVVGAACGGFITAFNISCYVMNGFRFPFLATLANPFFKFCLNNCIIPLAFVITYCINIYYFQINEHLIKPVEAVTEIIGFLSGIALFILFAIIYFNKFNKDIFKMFGVKINDENGTQPIRDNMLIRSIPGKNDRDWHIETYLSSFSSIRLARGFKHYKKEMLIKVFKQNHYMAAIFEILSIMSLIVLGLFREIPFFEIPAGASIFLLFTTYLMLSSALHSWFRGWSTTIFILALLLLNYLYSFNFLNSDNRAYGLNYDNEKTPFTNARLMEDDSKKEIKQKDVEYTIEILNKWRLKNATNSLKRKKKPKLVIINTSGGGMRSTMWTFTSLQYADSILGGELLKHTQLIAGSSGGILGAAYLRELYLLKQEKKINSYHDISYIKNITKDILNPIAFSIATNDLFFRFQRFKDGKYSYAKDRGYAFEWKLNENTNFILDKRLGDYRQPEAEALIPMMVLNSTILNDGRKMLISPQPISYLTQNSIRGTVSVHPLIESIEFSRFFEKQNADNLKFTSALRMNATFPYIMPVVSLPSEPEIEVMDAGMRDNFGLEITLKYLYTFRNWITSNTSGVIILQVRDRHKEIPIDATKTGTLNDILSRPLGSFYGNLFNTQDFTQNQQIQYASLWFEGKIDFVDFEMRNENQNTVSLSWHLTNKEKKNILESIYLPENQESIRRLKELLE